MATMRWNNVHIISQVQREVDEAVDVAESLYEVDADCRSVLAES